MPDISEDTAATETATETQDTEVAEAVADATEETPAEAENTETEEDASAETVEPSGAAKSTHVPYARFKTVVAARNALQSELATLREENARLKGPTKPEVPLTDDPKKWITGKMKAAPKGLSEMDAFEFYMAQALDLHADRVFAERLGMEPQAAAANLREATVTNADRIRTQWEASAKAHGVDPKNPAWRRAVGTALDSGEFKSFDEAFTALLGPVKKVATPQNGKTVKAVGVGAESEGVDAAAISSVKGLPRTAAEANELARQGKKVAHASVTDILASFGSS